MFKILLSVYCTISLLNIVGIYCKRLILLITTGKLWLKRYSTSYHIKRNCTVTSCVYEFMLLDKIFPTTCTVIKLQIYWIRLRVCLHVHV